MVLPVPIRMFVALSLTLLLVTPPKLAPTTLIPAVVAPSISEVVTVPVALAPEINTPLGPPEILEPWTVAVTL